MSDFYTLTVENVTKETKDCVSVTFNVPKVLQNSLQYKSGQYLVLKKNINNEDVRRSYSLCSSPIENKWQVAIKEIKNGKFSTYANQTLKTGDTIEVSKPEGKFYIETNTKNTNNYVFFAAGSGITPIISMIKTILKTEPNSTCQLFFLNSTVKSIIFKDEIEGLKNLNLSRLELYYFLTKENRGFPLFNGRFTSEKLKEITEKLINTSTTKACYVCGPEEMIFLIKEEMIAAGMSQEKIHFELFNTSKTEANKKHIAEVLEHQADYTSVTIIDGNKEFHFNMDGKHDNILDAALSNDADLPFACKGGVCCTCKAKVLEGKVEMKLNYGLESYEVEAGYVLTCQAVPITEKVIVDFDA